jgi:hypothetical protein
MTDAELTARLRANLLTFRLLQARQGRLRMRELPGVRAFALPELGGNLFQQQVLYEDSRALAGALEPLEAWYREQGVQAWRVPVYPGDVTPRPCSPRPGTAPATSCPPWASP